METSRMTFYRTYAQFLFAQKRKGINVTLLDEPMHTMLKTNYCMLTFLSVGVADKKMVFLHRVLLPLGPLVLGPPWLLG